MKIKVFAKIEVREEFEMEVSDELTKEEIWEVAQNSANEQSDNTIYVPTISIWTKDKNECWVYV